MVSIPSCFRLTHLTLYVETLHDVHASRARVESYVEKRHLRQTGEFA
jgi:hypothetical protein